MRKSKLAVITIHRSAALLVSSRNRVDLEQPSSYKPELRMGLARSYVGNSLS